MKSNNKRRAVMALLMLVALAPLVVPTQQAQAARLTWTVTVLPFLPIVIIVPHIEW